MVNREWASCERDAAGREGGGAGDGGQREEERGFGSKKHVLKY